MLVTKGEKTISVHSNTPTYIAQLTTKVSLSINNLVVLRSPARSNQQLQLSAHDVRTEKNSYVEIRLKSISANYVTVRFEYPLEKILCIVI